MIGFGAGIDSGKHYKPLLDLIDKIEAASGKKAFIFSTSAIQGKDKVKKDHKAARDKLTSKGFELLGEFSCKGFNTNSFLKFFGGMNKRRPNSDDIQSAKAFAENLANIL